MTSPQGAAPELPGDCQSMVTERGKVSDPLPIDSNTTFDNSWSFHFNTQFPLPVLLLDSSGSLDDPDRLEEWMFQGELVEGGEILDWSWFTDEM